MPESNTTEAPFRYPGKELFLFEKATRWKEYFSGMIRPFLQGNVLETGAGIGGSTPYLVTPAVTSWICLEPDTENLEKIRLKIEKGELPPLCKPVAGTIQDLLPAEQFDCILYLDVLEHIQADREEIQLAVDHLNTNGRLIILSPAHQDIFSAFDEAIGHHRRYDLQSLSSIIPSTLRIQKFVYLDSLGYLSYQLFSRFRNKPMPSKKEVLFWDKILVPVSSIVDPLYSYRKGRSLLGVWCKT